jgi:peptidoglycan/LPS O-acetylase OafA/YrhL
MTPAASRFIDVIRWLAALLVVLFHASNVFVNNADIMTAPHGPLVYIWWFITPFAFAHEGLVMFFVFSGVLVGGAVAQRMRKPERFLTRYFIDRVARIYIVLIPVLLIGFCIDMGGKWLFAGRGVYEAPFFAGHFEPWLLLPTLASLQGIWFIPFGTNEPLWSLGMECWYYVVFPLLLLPLAGGYGKASRVFGCILGVAIFAVMAASGSYFAFGFLPWVFGAAARLAPRPLIRSKFVALFIWIAVSIVFRLAIPGSQLDQFPTKAFTDGINALLMANLIVTLRFDTGEGFRFAKLTLHKRMADFSYSVYALHLPILIFAWAATEALIRPGWRAELARPEHYAMAIGCTLLVLVLAYALSRVTEAKTDVVRRWAHGLLLPTPTRLKETAPAS